MPWPATAAHDVLVVLAEHSPVHDQVVTSLRANLGEAATREIALRVVTAAEFSGARGTEPDRGAPALLVTVGTGAARAVLRQPVTVPVYCTFLPRAAYEVLARDGDAPASAQRVPRSALYLDQPFVRQLQLLHLALPAFRHVGVVLGPESRESATALRQAASALNLVLHIHSISDEKQLIEALNIVMDKADVLLAVPDPVVFNRQTAQSVLLTTYRMGKPVVAYSRAYVIAGALMSVYTTPAQIGQEIAEELPALLDSPGGKLPPPRYPRYYSVQVNQRVARSLGLNLESASALTRELADSPAKKRPYD
jgi:putative ABC transport system substrate-binding protein